MKNNEMCERLEYTLTYFLETYKEYFEDIFLCDMYKNKIIGYLTALLDIGLINYEQHLSICKSVIYGRFEELENLEIFGEK